MSAGGEDHLCRGQLQAGGGGTSVPGVHCGEHNRPARYVHFLSLSVISNVLYISVITLDVAEETCTMDPTQDCKNVTTRQEDIMESSSF